MPAPRPPDRSAPPASAPSPPSDLASVHEAAHALHRGEPLVALSLVGRVESASGLTLRGIAYAQLGDLDPAKAALERALSLAQDDDPLGRARARAALVEIALATDEPSVAARAAAESVEELERAGDVRNAAMQRLVLARAEVLMGRLGEAGRVVEGLLAGELTRDLRAVAWLARAEIAVRAIATTEARDALGRARKALDGEPNYVLLRAIDALERELSLPVARLFEGGVTRDADLFDVERASNGDRLLVDACRRLVIAGRATLPLARRPVLFGLLRALGSAWPASVPRDELAARVFDARRVNASHRARMRVEIGRLRKTLSGLGAEPVATPEGYALRSKRDVVVLLPPSEEDAARIALLLADGASWSAQGLADHAGISKRTAQRALGALVASGQAIRTGKGRRRKYASPGTPIASRMLLLGLLPRT